MFIAVGTPSRRGDGHADLSYVHAAAAEIAGHVRGFTVVVTKSTVPVGTGDEVERIIARAAPGAEVAVVSNPEFLREGAAIGDFKRPDRVVVGTDDERAQAVMRELYRPLNLNESPLLFTSRRTSELIKYAANAFLALKITYINEMADLCEAVGGRRAAGRPRHRAGQPDRPQVPARRARLRRLLLPQGHPGPGAHRRRRRRAVAPGGGHRGGERRAQAGAGRAGGARRRGRSPGQDDRRAGADLQAQHRRHARRPGAGPDPRPPGRRRQGAGLRPRRHARGRPPAGRASTSATALTRSPRAPTRW